MSNGNVIAGVAVTAGMAAGGAALASATNKDPDALSKALAPLVGAGVGIVAATVGGFALAAISSRPQTKMIGKVAGLTGLGFLSVVLAMAIYKKSAQTTSQTTSPPASQV